MAHAAKLIIARKLKTPRKYTILLDKGGRRGLRGLGYAPQLLLRDI